MVYLNQQKPIYAEKIQGASSNQEIFTYKHASEQERKQLEMQRESAELLRGLQREVYAKKQQLKRMEKSLKEIDKNKKHNQQLQEKIVHRLDLLDDHAEAKNKQWLDVLATQEMAKQEAKDFKDNQILMQAKLEKIERENKNNAEKQQNKLDEIYHQTKQREEAFTKLHERLDKHEAWLEKLMRQVHDLRGIIYERADEIIKKLEKSMHLFGSKWSMMQRNDTTSSKETSKQ